MSWHAIGQYGPADLPRIAAALAPHILPQAAIGLVGALGAGKTTLVRAILSALGHAGEVPSPSYALVQPYHLAAPTLDLLHVDLYRIESGEDIAELGLGDALRSHALLIEWPDRLMALPGFGLGLKHLPMLAISGNGEQRQLAHDDADFWNRIAWPTL